MKVVAIDPAGCGCTECLTGEYAPLNRADARQIFGLLTGELGNNLDDGTEVEITTTLTCEADEKPLYATPDKVIVKISGYSWTLTGEALTLLRP